MTRHCKTNTWTATAVAAAGNPIDSRWQLQLRTFEPSAPQPAAWHAWARQTAIDAQPASIDIKPRKSH